VYESQRAPLDEPPLARTPHLGHPQQESFFGLEVCINVLQRCGDGFWNTLRLSLNIEGIQVNQKTFRVFIDIGGFPVTESGCGLEYSHKLTPMRPALTSRTITSYAMLKNNQ
jgi:hypothetical protein